MHEDGKHTRAKRRILVVDDDPSASETLVRALMLEGYSAYAVQTGDNAILLSKALSFDLVLIDLNMPGKNGWQTLAVLRMENPRLIVITALPDQKKASAVGLHALFEKPLNFPELLRIICELLAPSEHNTLPTNASKPTPSHT